MGQAVLRSGDSSVVIIGNGFDTLIHPLSLLCCCARLGLGVSGSLCRIVDVL